MAALVEQLLDLSRLDADAVDVAAADGRAAQPAGRGRRRRGRRAGARGRGVDRRRTDAAIVDPPILEHIVTNLVTNALRYGRAPVVRLAPPSTAGLLRVSVEDSGPGVAREIEETLFERFTRAGVARDRVAGTGLGLAIARAYALRPPRRAPLRAATARRRALRGRVAVGLVVAR